MKKSILLVDDNRMLLDTFQKILRLDGHDVTCFQNGKQALDSLGQNMFQIAIVDYNLPGMNGAQFVKAIRSQCPDALIIGFSLEFKEKEFLEAGADVFYIKSHVHEMMSRISQAA